MDTRANHDRQQREDGVRPFEVGTRAGPAPGFAGMSVDVRDPLRAAGYMLGLVTLLGGLFLYIVNDVPGLGPAVRRAWISPYHPANAAALLHRWPARLAAGDSARGAPGVVPPRSGVRFAGNDRRDGWAGRTLDRAGFFLASEVGGRRAHAEPRGRW